jgi:hypothetical protein
MNRNAGREQTMPRNVTIIALTTFALSTATSADITGVQYCGLYIDAADYTGTPDFSGFVVDLWLTSDDDTDTVLNVFNVNIDNSVGAESYYQSFTGGTWLPNNIGAPFETEALMHADSFVSMGGRDSNAESAYGDIGWIEQMDPNGTGLDPNFGGTVADAPGEDAGWYNSNPENYIGSPINGKIFIGRFALNGEGYFDLSGVVSVTWNNGIGTEGHQVENLAITLCPAPGALALIGVAGLAGSRRRRT